jgi:hypothetical protein
VRTRATSQHRETSHCMHRPGGARTRVRTTSSSKRGAKGCLLDELPSFVRKVILNGNKFSQKSSTYNNLDSMAATVVCNYNETAGFPRRGPGPQSVFMNGLVYHYMRIASSTSQNCGSLAGSADAQNVDPLIMSDICSFDLILGKSISSCLNGSANSNFP